MVIHRIASRKHIRDLSGEGARLFGGRWNSAGKRMIYTSESVSLCVCENLVHFSTNTPPGNMMHIKLEIRDDLISEEFRDHDYSSDPYAYEKGDLWLESMSSLAIIVPSKVVREEYNILINPLHPRFESIKVIDLKEFDFDFRFFAGS